MTLTERKKILQNTFNFSPKISLYPQRWQEKKDSRVANGKTAKQTAPSEVDFLEGKDGKRFSQPRRCAKSESRK